MCPRRAVQLEGDCDFPLEARASARLSLRHTCLGARHPGVVVLRRAGHGSPWRCRSDHLHTANRHGADDHHAARLPRLLARLGEARSCARAAPRAAATRLPRVRSLRKARRAFLFDPRAGRPGRGPLGAGGDRLNRDPRARLRALRHAGATRSPSRRRAGRRPRGRSHAQRGGSTQTSLVPSRRRSRCWIPT